MLTIFTAVQTIGHSGKLLENIGNVPSNFRKEREFQEIAKSKYICYAAKLEIKRTKKIYINLRNGK